MTTPGLAPSDEAANTREHPARAVLGTATATAVILGCGVVTGVIAARSLGPGGRGDLATITVWTGTLLYAGTIGLPEAIAYFSAAHPDARTRIWTTGQAAAAVLGALVTVVGWWCLPLILPADRGALAQWLRWYLVLFATPCLLSLCACAWLQGAGRLRAFNVCRTAVHVANAAGMGILFLLGDSSVTHFACVLLVGNAVTWLLATALGPVTHLRAAPVSLPLAGQLIRYGIRVQVGNWSNTANVRLDQLMLTMFAPASALGLYVVAVTYASVLQAIPGSAAFVMLPDIVRRHSEGTSGACLEAWYRQLLWVSLLAAVALGSTGALVIPALFGPGYSAAAPLLLYLVPAAIMLGMNQVLATAFRGIGSPEVGSTSELLGVVVTILGLATLLPRYGIYGAAAASLAAYTTSHVYLTRRALSVFGGDVRSLYVPRLGDLRTVRTLTLAMFGRTR